MSTYDNLTVLDHPILAHKLGHLRDASTTTQQFRQIVREMAQLITYEAGRDLETIGVDIETPLTTTTAKRIDDPPMVISVMRAGNGMLDGALNVLPFASAGHIGIYRDTFIGNTVEYYFKIPDEPARRRVLLIDPLVATGNTILAAIDRLRQYRVGRIDLLAIVVAPDGVERIGHFHPDVHIWAAALDEGLTDAGYILPGLGDSGDRLYGTQ